MSEEILETTENTEEVTEEIKITEEEPAEETTGEIVKIPQRVNPFCVISKNTFGNYAVRDIQTNSSWSSNPYGEEYAVVPDDMVTDIIKTRGFCDIKLNEEETEVVSFTAREIPEIPVPEAGPTLDERVTELETTVDEMAAAIVEGVNEA